MKKIVVYSLLLAAAGFGFTACEADKPDAESIFKPIDDARETEFDRWLYENYTSPYNIDFIWRMNDMENDNTYDLVPARYADALKIAKICKHLWCDAYDELMGQEFLRRYAPRVLYLVGTVGYEEGSIKLGTAEGGLKITLYATNWIDVTNVDFMNEYYFKTMHHEFAHILHQTKDYPQEFNLITASDYTPNGWINRTDEEANKLGFVTSYGSSEPQEDFVETIANYVVKSDEAWNAILTTAGDKASIIRQKLEICRQYLKNSWSLDLDKLHEIVQRRQNEIGTLDLEHVY